MTKKEFEKNLEFNFKKFTTNNAGDTTTYEFGFPKQTATITDCKVAGISVSFLLNLRDDKRQITINQIYHWEDAYQLIALGLSEPEKFRNWDDKQIKLNPESYRLKNRVPADGNWEPSGGLIDIDDDSFQFALEMVKLGAISSVRFSLDKIIVSGDYALCRASSSLHASRNTAITHMKMLVNGVEGTNGVNRLNEDKTVEWDSLKVGLLSKCPKHTCQDPCCIMLTCAYLEYIIRYGDLSKALGERIRVRREYRTPTGPYPFTWQPGGKRAGIIRMIPANVYYLAEQMLRDGQIELSKSLQDDNSVEIISHIKLPVNIPQGSSFMEITFCQLAIYAGERKGKDSWDPPFVYKINVRDDILAEGLSIQELTYICAGYINYLRNCGMQDLIDRERELYSKNQNVAEKRLQKDFYFTLPTDLFMNEPDEMFRFAEIIQEKNYVSMENHTVIQNGIEFYNMDIVGALAGDTFISENPQEFLVEQMLPHGELLSDRLSVSNTLERVNDKHLWVAGYIDYLLKTGQYDAYTKRRLLHREETAAQLESNKSENPELEKVLNIAQNEADTALFCMIEAERGAGQDEIVEQIARLLAQRGKLEKSEPVKLTFLQMMSDPNHGEIPKKTMFVLSGLREFLFHCQNAIPGDGKPVSHMIELLGRYVPETFVIILAEQANVAPFLKLSPQIRFLFGDNIIPIKNMSPEKMYEAFTEKLPDELKVQLTKDTEFKDTFLNYIALNRDLLPLDNQELAEYLAAYAGSQKALRLPPDVNRTQSAREMLDSVIGMANVKKKAYEFEKYAIFRKRAEMNGMELPNSHMHMVFTGNPGTGKTMIARIMAQMLYSIGIVKTNNCLEVERKDLVGGYVGQTAIQTESVIKDAMDGVLFIDEAYSLAPQHPGDYGGEAIATLIKAMEDHQDRLVVIFAGYEKEMHEFLTANPGLVSRIGYTFHFDDYSADELERMFDTKMRKAGFEYQEDEFLPPIQDLCEHFSEQKDFGNGRFVDRLMQSVILKHSQRELTNEMICSLDIEDIPSVEALTSTDEEEHLDYEEQLEAFVGMENVKAKIRQFATLVEFQQKAKKEGAKIPGGNLHMIFTGNPGTGKTTIARIMADMLFSIGAIQTHKFIEAERKDLVGEYVGQTAIKTSEVIDRAMGGILFIDEAYTLTPDSGNDFCAEAIATLIKAMEDNKNNLIVIFAGYKEEMRQFKKSNPGIASRIGYTFDFDDYSTEELMEIFLKKAESAHFYVEEDAKQGLRILFDYFTKQKNFGNGRFVDRLLQETIMKHSENLDDDANLLNIRVEDIPGITDLTDTRKDSSSALSLDSVIGMWAVKEKLEEFEHFVNFGMVARDRGLSIPDFNMHMLFTGNPGTGKTMIARIIAQRLYDIGVVQTNNFVEVERKDLVSEYLGQTAAKTADVIEKAMGGILFIDEAYSLTPDSSGGRSDYGDEAISTLIKAMEDHKDNLIVIFAGYKDEMGRFLNSNPGIASRIGFTFEFEDYSPDELLAIFLNKMTANGFTTCEEAQERVLRLMEQFSERPNFGNGRFVDNVIQKTLLHHATNYVDDNVEIIRAEDIPDGAELVSSIGVA